jgi:hypothetical protein
MGERATTTSKPAVFSYLGDADMSFKVFDTTSCHRHYHSDDEEEDD